jgi:hypothetical protein
LLAWRTSMGMDEVWIMVACDTLWQFWRVIAPIGSYTSCFGAIGDEPWRGDATFAGRSGTNQCSESWRQGGSAKHARSVLDSCVAQHRPQDV